nr:BspA family leucine-rich repeat surface protein [uncultured Halomonas sp.]
MFSVIVTIVSIVLVAVLAAVSVYYGGQSLWGNTMEARVGQLINEHNQLDGAMAIWRNENGAPPTDGSFAYLKDAELLMAIPNPERFSDEGWGLHGPNNVLGLALNTDDGKAVCDHVMGDNNSQGRYIDFGCDEVGGTPQVFHRVRGGADSGTGTETGDPEGGDPSDPALPENVACYEPANVGQIGTEGACTDMLIVDNSMMKAVGGYPGDSSYSIAHADSGRVFTFADDANNVFTGQVTDMSRLFRFATANVDVGYWETRNVVDMNMMFYGASSFNQDISDWNTASVTNMSGMFRNATSFNQPIGNWSTNQVADMSQMFWGAAAFNQPIGSWNTANVTTMRNMFEGAVAFDQYIGGWNTSKVTWLQSAFEGASSFNQDISGWDVSGVTLEFRMRDAFNGATNFNQDLSCWEVPTINAMPSNFDTNAIEWVDIDKKPNWGQPLSVACGGVEQEPLDCYAPENIGKVGNAGVCDGMLIVDSVMLGSAPTDPQNYKDRSIYHSDSGTRFTFGDDDKNIFTGQVDSFYGLFRSYGYFNSDIGYWETSNVTDMGEMFYGAGDFNQDISGWDVTKVSNMYRMFRNATNFNQDINGWSVLGVENMESLFDGAEAFNKSLSGWKVSNVQTMDYMFRGADAFNQNLTCWDVKGIPSVPTEFISMFSEVPVFRRPYWGNDPASQCVDNYTCYEESSVGHLGINSPCQGMLIVDKSMLDGAEEINAGEDRRILYTDINTGDTSYFTFGDDEKNIFTGQVTSLQGLFSGSNFNSDIEYWDVSNVSNMRSLFRNADSFNRPLNGWVTSSLTNMNGIFAYNDAFNQPLDFWDVSNVNDAGQAFLGTTEFNQSLGSWVFPSNTLMMEMFKEAEKFNQDLSCWDVEHRTAPFGFSTRALYEWRSSDYQPKWNDPPNPICN